MKKFYGKQKFSDNSNHQQIPTIGFLKRHFLSRRDFEKIVPNFDSIQDEGKVLKIVEGQPQWVKETND